MTVLIVLVSVVVMPVAMGMLFARKAPWKPVYDRIP